MLIHALFQPFRSVYQIEVGLKGRVCLRFFLIQILLNVIITPPTETHLSEPHC